MHTLVVLWSLAFINGLLERARNDVCAGIVDREEDSLCDTSTLADPSVVQTLLSLRGK